MADLLYRGRYEANLENAKQTFTRHSSLVAADLSACAAERDRTLLEALMAFHIGARRPPPLPSERVPCSRIG